jgi:S-DNA-T family DNA segregation ATPase FtsK/SpoIIIE
VVALIVATDVKIQKVWAVTWAAIRSAWGWAIAKIADAVDRHRIAVAEMRAEEAVERAREEELAASAVVEDASGEEQEGRAMAGALVREKKRARLDDEPAWATADEEDDELPRRRRRGREERGEEPIPTPMPVVVSAVPPEPTPEPLPVESGPARPEIVVSAAMQ